MDELKRLLEPASIVGDQIVLEDKIMIPITKIGAGFGSGVGLGKGRGGEKGVAEGEGSGSGAGGGGGIAPVAMLTIFKGVKGPEGIKVLPLESPSPISKAISDAVPSVAEAIKKAAAKTSKEGKK